MTEQRLGCEEQMEPAAPSVVESGDAEAVKQQLEATDLTVAAALNFSFEYYYCVDCYCSRIQF